MICGLDFETDWNEEKTETWVVQFAFWIENKVYCGEHLEQFERILLKKNFWNKKNFIYVHNLAFDLEFFKYTLYKLSKMDKNTLDCVFVNRTTPVQITLTISDTQFIFRDSMKKIQGSLKSLGKIVGIEKLENNEVFTSGWSRKLDFNDYRNWDYVKRDSEIVQKAMKKLHDNQQSKSTASGDAFYYFIQKFNEGYYNTKDSKFAKKYPPLSFCEDAYFRLMFMGGMNFTQNIGKMIKNKMIKNILKKIYHLDITSSYPYQMYSKYLPFGKPILLEKGEKPPTDCLYTKTFKAKIYLKKNKIPWFRFKNIKEQIEEGLTEEENVIETQFYHVFSLCNVDIENLEKSYHIEYDPEFEETTHIFQKSKGDFCSYIDQWIDVKNKTTGVERQIAKNMLNHLYGRFALNPNGIFTTLIHDEEKDDLKFHHTEVTTYVTNYLPIAIYVTAYGRSQLIDKLNEVSETNGTKSVIHCDTDSIIFYGNYDKESDDFLGGWKLEKTPVAIIEGGFKRYVEFYNYPPTKLEDINLKCAGISQRIDNDGLPYGSWVEILDDPKIIASQKVIGQTEYKIKSKWLKDLFKAKKRKPVVNTMQLKRKKVKGGVILVENTVNLHAKWVVK